MYDVYIHRFYCRKMEKKAISIDSILIFENYSFLTVNEIFIRWYAPETKERSKQWTSPAEKGDAPHLLEFTMYESNTWRRIIWSQVSNYTMVSIRYQVAERTFSFGVEKHRFG